MDVKREGVAKKKMIKRVIILTLTVAAVAAISWQLSILKPAAPTVERATVWIDSVKRGPMVRDVRGLGTLVPEDIIQIPALFDSQVAKIEARSGDDVKPNAVLLVLSNPDMEQQAEDLQWQVKAADAQYKDLKVRLQSSTFDQQSVVESTLSDMKQAELTKDRDQELLKLNLKADLDVKLSVANWEKLVGKYKIEKQKLDILQQSVDAQLENAQVQIDKLKAPQWALKKKQVDESYHLRRHRRQDAGDDPAGGAAGEAGRCAGKGGATLEADGAPEYSRNSGERHLTWTKS